MNFDPKIINKIYKCSGKQYLNVSSIPCNNEHLNCCFNKITKMAELNHLLKTSNLMNINPKIANDIPK